MKRRDIATRAMSVILSVTLAAVNCPVYSLAEDVAAEVYEDAALAEEPEDGIMENGSEEESPDVDSEENELPPVDAAPDGELIILSESVEETEAAGESWTDDGSASEISVEMVEEVDSLDASVEVSAGDGGDAAEDAAYVMMNVPYDVFYAAVAGIESGVDAVSSATSGKWQSQAGTYYRASESGTGGQIQGVTVPVVAEPEGLTAVSATKVERENVNAAGAYAYYVPSSADAAYILKLDQSGKISAPEGTAAALPGADAQIAYASNFGDYQISMNGVSGIGEIYGVTLTTAGKTYALRHLENIWHGGEQLAWSVGEKTTEPHGNTLSSAQYADMQGKTITAVTYYTSTGVYEVPTSLLVKKKTGITVTAESGSAGSGSVAVSFSSTLPEDFVPVYTVEGMASAEYSDGYLEYFYAAPGSYTLTVSDAGGTYCDLTAGFVLSTAEQPAVYDPESKALVKAEGFTKSQLKAYLSSITSVSVDGVSYSVSGKGAVTVINGDGTLNTSAVSRNGAIFASTKEYAVTVTAAGYENLSFTYVKEPLCVMLNIPYSDYYSLVLGSELQVDAVSSATSGKWQTQAGTYFAAADKGGQILGVTVSVQVNEEDIPDTWTAADAQSGAAYAYYPASEASGAYMEYADGSLKLTRAEASVVEGASASIVYNSNYGDYQLTVDGIGEIGTVYGVTLQTAEKTYALRHLENIWRSGAQLAWSVGVKTTEQHGNTLSSAQYEDMQGSTITAVTYYSSTGVYVVPTQLPVKKKTNVTIQAADGPAGEGSVEVTLSGTLPEDFAAEYTVAGLDTDYKEGTLSYTGAQAGSYTLTVSDASGTYCELTASFTLSTQEVPAVYDEKTYSLVAAEGFTDAQLAGYLKNISSVSVDGTAYAASGRNAVKIINSDGSLNFYAVSRNAAVFTSGTECTVTVSARGYQQDLVFTAVPAPKYGTMTMTYAEFYNGLAKDAADIDAVSSATTSKSKTFGNADSTEVTSDGYQILGVKNVPVVVEPGASAALVERVAFGEDPYTEEEGAQYWTVDAQGISMSEDSMKVAAVVDDAEVTLSTSSNWGAYEITVTEKSTGYLRNSRTDEGFAVGSGILGILVETSQGGSYGLTHMNNIWVQPYKFAFTPAESPTLAGLVGETIRSVTFIMPEAVYVYTVSSGLYIKPAFAEGITGAFNEDGTVFTLDQKLTGLTNAQISVTYKEGRAAKTLLASVPVEDKTEFTLETAVPEGVVPTVTVSSDEYADITVEYPMYGFQREQLAAQAAQAEILLTYGESGILKAHMEEANELLADEEGSAQAAAELISELSGLIKSAEAALTVAVDGADVSEAVSLGSLWNEETENYDISKLDLTNTDVFAEGAAGAYLFTIGEKTVVVGDTSLARWAGNWENWQTYVKPSASKAKRYPLLGEVWDLAYEGYIGVFTAIGMGDAIKAMYPDTDSLKEYWYNMTNTYSAENAATVNEIQIKAADGGYLLSWIDASGRTLAQDEYLITGKLNKGLEGATMYVLTARNLAEGSPFKYLVTMEPDYETTGNQPVAGHYHFQYGSSLDKLLNYGQLYTGTETNIADKYWYATMTNSDASDIAKYNVILAMHKAAKWTEGDLNLAKAELAETTYIADGSVRRPEVISVKTASGRTVPEEYYTVSYGTAAKTPGTYTVTVTAKEGYAGSAAATFTIKEKETSSGQTGSTGSSTNIGTGTGTGTATPAVTVKNATKLKVKSSVKKKVKVSWKKRSGVSGYQIQYSTSKKFKKATLKKVSAKKSTYTIKKLKSKKTYYVRIRTYKKVNGKTYYSSWSKAKKVKVK